MDATRADIEFTAEVCAIAVEEGATVVNIPDTVGYTTPEEYADYFRRLYELVPALREVELSVHCHDDLGLAVANSYAGVLAGARQVECAINGIGERAGNCSLEEIAMLVKVREDAHGLTTGINTREIARTSRMVSRLTGYAIQPNKAIVGRNAFAHESGIHQDGVLKERSTYEIMDATEVGLESNSIVLGKHSGRHALKDALEQLGFQVEGNALNAAFKAFKEVADRKKQVTALDLEAIVSDEMRERSDAHELAWFEVEAGSRREPVAKVAVTLPSGEEVVGESGGDGPVDAIFRAIQSATETECELAQYTVEAVTGGEDALGEVTVMLRTAGRLATGQGVATDILEASARAYVRALSNALEGAATREAEAATAEAAIERTPDPSPLPNSATIADPGGEVPRVCSYAPYGCTGADAWYRCRGGSTGGRPAWGCRAATVGGAWPWEARNGSALAIWAIPPPASRRLRGRAQSHHPGGAVDGGGAVLRAGSGSEPPLGGGAMGDPVAFAPSDRGDELVSRLARRLVFTGTSRGCRRMR